MKLSENFYEDFIRTAKEICEANNRVADETHNLLVHLEKAHNDVMAQSKENMAIIRGMSDRLLSKIDRLNPANEEEK